MLEQFGELLLAREAFPCSDGHRTTSRHLHHGRNVGVVDRLLEPGRTERVDGLGELDGGGDVEARVAFDQEVHRRAHRLAHGPDNVQREVEFGAREHAPGGPEGVELEGPCSPRAATSLALAAKFSGVRGPRYQPLA